MAYLKSDEILHVNSYATAQNCLDALIEKYSLQEYTPELAQAHGVRAAYPSFGIEYIQNVLQANINSAFLALA